MFSEYLRGHPLLSLLSDQPDWGLPTAEDRPAWERIGKLYAEELAALAKDYGGIPYPPRTASGFLAFTCTGSRSADEQPYFLRRRKLCAAVLACCVSGNAPLDDVIDGVWCVCEETSWVISAHNVNPIPGAPAAKEYPLPDIEKPYIDLFAAQTAMILSLTRRLLQRRLDDVTPLICRRIEKELRVRVLTPFLENDDFWWMGFRRSDLCNWTPWIVSNVMLTSCLYPMEKEKRAALLTRGCGMLDRWLGCMPADGGCDEGAGYWNMAGGALLDCLQLLSDATGGKMTFWDDRKVQNILRFPLAAEIGNGWFMNFADCDARPMLSGERLQYAGEMLNDPALTALGVRFRGTLADQLNDVPHFIRLLRMLFHDAGERNEPMEKPDAWLPDLQVRMVRRDGFTLCCKGGHNGESHNHNDVGSFLLYADGRPVLVDAGNMTYTAQTFSDQRYTLWNVRSAYHNLPMIGGQEQQPGRMFAASHVECLTDGMSLNIEGAYARDAGVQTLRRRMELTENAFMLTDSIALHQPVPVTWVFMLREKPEISENTVISGTITMVFPAALTPSIEEIPITDPRMARSFPGSLWRVLLTSAPANAIDAQFTVRRNAFHA